VANAARRSRYGVASSRSNVSLASTSSEHDGLYLGEDRPLLDVGGAFVLREESEVPVRLVDPAPPRG
jgi:hypothetical protein